MEKAASGENKIDNDEIFNNTIKEKPKSIFDKYGFMQVSDNRRPVYGVITEPIRGNVKSSREAELHPERLSYIPKAHVQFLEQSGIRVVPISYLDSPEEIEELLDQVNGVYLPGDSPKAISNMKYQEAFSVVFNYFKAHNKKNDYFPMFMMGKSSHIFFSQIAISKSILKSMKQWTNANSYLKMLKNHDDTFLLHQLNEDLSTAHAFDLGQFFNKQSEGV